MKIRLLLQREPFAEILRRTLVGQAHQLGYDTVDIQWRDIPWWSRHRHVADEDWLCHRDLNVIFSPRVDVDALQPVIHEFATSPFPLRGGLQRHYVATALHPGTARWLAQNRLTMSPEWLDPRNQVIIPGNQKIRILDRSSQQSIALWKDRFPRTNFHREIEGRRIAASHAIHVPQLLQVDETGGWYCEEYLDTTPLNRLIDPAQRDRVACDAWHQLAKLIQATIEPRALGDYVDQHIRRIEQLAGELAWLSPAECRDLFQLVCQIRDFVVAGEERRLLSTALTHGDFQAANIVVTGSEVWIIDWECFQRRLASYDAWVLATGARSSRGLMHRIRQTGQDGNRSRPSLALLSNAIRTLSDLPLPRQAGLFLLEEVVARLENDSNPNFPVGAGELRSLLPVVANWRRAVT